jgi:hypothetical protein
VESPRIHADFNARLDGDRFWVLVKEDLEKYQDMVEQGLEILLCDLDDDFYVQATLDLVRDRWVAIADMSTIVYLDDPTTP